MVTEREKAKMEREKERKRSRLEEAVVVMEEVQNQFSPWEDGLQPSMQCTMDNFL